MIGIVDIVCSHSLLAEEQGKIKMLQLEISRSSGFSLPNEMKKIVFSTSQNAVSGWLRENGDWYIEATIQHRSFLCADYQVGVQFGQGDTGCLNVNWISDVQYATHQKQCNNAVLVHSGYQSNSDLLSHFGSITCVKAVIKCEGSC